jgi:hypothetical protein
MDTRVPIPPTDKLGREQWHVDSERKVLVCDGDGGHDMLLYKQDLGDSVFHFEFCYTKIEGKTGYNSGAYVRNSADGAVWHQAQFGDAKDGFLFGETPTPDGKRKFFSLAKQVTDMRIKPVGDWNTLEVTARGKTLTLWANGAVTCQFKRLRRASRQGWARGRGLPDRIPEFEGQEAASLTAEPFILPPMGGTPKFLLNNHVAVAERIFDVCSAGKEVVADSLGGGPAAAGRYSNFCLELGIAWALYPFF